MDWTLKPLAGSNPRPGPILVVVMDGIGLGAGDEGDAVALARTPVLDWLQTNCSWVSLQAHGTAVGLPSDADMGNSEVGHNALGAGRVFDQGAKLVDGAIRSGAIFAGALWRELVARCRAGGALHLIGLLSDGNVHSHQDHLHALIDQAARDGVRRLFVHPLLDGRDVPETSALEYLDRLEEHLAGTHGGGDKTYRIASGGGRMVTTMDRYQADWQVVERGWNAHVHGQGRGFPSARAAIEAYRAEDPGIIDQFLPPFVVTEGDQPVGRIADGDVVVFFNFRGDRALEISHAFEDEAFDHFDRGRRPDVLYAGMMEYDGDLHVPRNFLVTPPRIDRTLGEYLARNKVRQYACSETQKFGHVTYFWNGNRTGMFDPEWEEYLEIPSDRVPFQERPWMKAADITAATIERLEQESFRCGRINYANGDMVGHTGDRRAAILAVEAVDLSLGLLLEALARVRGVALVTADHGNSDEMYLLDKAGRPIIDSATGRPQPCTAHSLNPVACILYDPVGLANGGCRLTATPPGIGRKLAPGASVAAGSRGRHPWSLLLPEGGAGLANLAATCLNLLGYEAPEGYAASLLRR